MLWYVFCCVILYYFCRTVQPASYKKSRATMKILIADSMHPSLFEMLEAQKWDYDYHPQYKREDIKNALPAYDGLMIRSKTFLDREMLENAKNLRFIARAGAGLDLIDLNVARELNIEVFHAGTGNRDAVAEHALGMLLALFTNILRADQQVRNGIWDREGNRGVELMGKTVGLIGYGNNGSATAKRLSGFGCKVLAYDKYRDQYGDAFAAESSIEEIQREADIISLHIPLTDITRQLVNDEFISAFAKPFYLLNLSRGEVVQLKAVTSALESGKIKGACLDVLENEKIGKLTPEQQEVFDYLKSSDRVVLTPHIAGWTHESYVRINEVLVEQIRNWL
ncbi:2-hydroxyacid dehydrogenase [Dyadobacter fermentans]|uniref:D-isomer specific 2-hydroxyacid dehydrogenase NAD-binding n=1 Tax=Dyadobacter fermentans (strain ATCC 700827 / DSM 18053 / CIP 107007 / KCTC 52180 / NS114) TaxID=471854 RepID=C6VZ76_DYAFD|nr:2-hydroxyacid dehydrogenase [Dyadobacter fermentans]ACT91688.1 D-isomer specific 2-hydroxyacid dehydrogenase NAD-binding [Dyadobacter fermentans DSM 18053]